MAETVRTATRRWASEEGADSDPVMALIESLDAAVLPEDLSTRQAAYAVHGYDKVSGRPAERATTGREGGTRSPRGHRGMVGRVPYRDQYHVAAAAELRRLRGR